MRHYTSLFAQLLAEIGRRFAGTLADAGAEFERTQTVRRELLRRVIALESADLSAVTEAEIEVLAKRHMIAVVRERAS